MNGVIKMTKLRRPDSVRQHKHKCEHCEHEFESIFTSGEITYHRCDICGMIKMGNSNTTTTFYPAIDWRDIKTIENKVHTREINMSEILWVIHYAYQDYTYFSKSLYAYLLFPESKLMMLSAYIIEYLEVSIEEYDY